VLTRHRVPSGEIAGKKVRRRSFSRWFRQDGDVNGIVAFESDVPIGQEMRGRKVANAKAKKAIFLM